MSTPDPPGSDLFGSEAFAALHAWRFGAAVRRSDARGTFHAVQLGPGAFASPGCGPHGGFGVTRAADLADVVHEAEAALRHTGARTLDLVMPPFCHHPQTGPRIFASLCALGYVVTRQELNQSLPVDGRPLPSLGTPAARKRINKARRLGVSAERLGPAAFRDAYDTILDNRRKKGRTLSMSWPDVAAMAGRFPNRVHMFGARQHGILAAAAICIAASPRVLYVYAWGERRGAEAVSPVTLLATEIHAFADQNGFGLLDLGTSSVGGVVDAGLAAFKRSLGAEPSLKVWLRKALPA